MEVERDNGGGDIWEWSDKHVSAYDQSLIVALVSAKSAKVQFLGDQYYKSRSLTKRELMTIREVYEYYKVLGGSIGR